MRRLSIIKAGIAALALSILANSADAQAKAQTVIENRPRQGWISGGMWTSAPSDYPKFVYEITGSLIKEATVGRVLANSYVQVSSDRKYPLSETQDLVVRQITPEQVILSFEYMLRGTVSVPGSDDGNPMHSDLPVHVKQEGSQVFLPLGQEVVVSPPRFTPDFRQFPTRIIMRVDKIYTTSRDVSFGEPCADISLRIVSAPTMLEKQE